MNQSHFAHLYDLKQLEALYDAELAEMKERHKQELTRLKQKYWVGAGTPLDEAIESARTEIAELLDHSGAPIVQDELGYAEMHTREDLDINLDAYWKWVHDTGLVQFIDWKPKRREFGAYWEQVEAVSPGLLHKVAKKVSTRFLYVRLFQRNPAEEA